MSEQFFQQFELPIIPPASQGVGNNPTIINSLSAVNTPYTYQGDSSNLGPRVESLEKYIQDIYTNYVKQGGDAGLNTINARNINVIDNFAATFGKIGGWYFANGVIQTSKILIDSNNENIRSANYKTGDSGFLISSNLVEAENIIARGVLRGATFAYNVVSAVGGQLMVANADTLAIDMNGLDACVLTTKGDSTFAVNDFLLMQAPTGSGIQTEWFRVNAKSGNIYTISRDLAGIYTTNNKPIWKAGTPVVKQGAWSGSSGNKYTAPILTGNNTPSALSVFQSLGNGANNGKIKLNINGVIYDNIAVDLSAQGNIAVGGTSGGAYGLYTHTCGQSFTLNKGGYISQIGLYTYRSGVGSNYNFQMILYAANSDGTPTGPVLATTTININNPPYGSGWQYLTVNQNLPAGKYHVYCPQSYQSYEWYMYVYYNSSSYSGGVAFYDGVAQTGKNLYMTVAIDGSLTYPIIADALQAAIRTTTSRLETAIYDTNHFTITGVTPDYYITALSPSSGVDLSGAGASKYYDLANGVSTQGGYGNGGWLRLIGEGTNSPYYSVYQRLSGLYNDYQEVCRLGNLNGFLGYTTDLYGIAIGDSSGFLKYDITNGLRLGGVSAFSIIASANLRTTNASGQATTSNTYVKVKETLYNEVSGIIRVAFDASASSNSGGNSYARIYKNGVAYGTERTYSTTGPTTFSEDLAFSTGDLIQVYAKVPSTYAATISNLKLSYDKSPALVTNTNNL